MGPNPPSNMLFRWWGFRLFFDPWLGLPVVEGVPCTLFFAMEFLIFLAMEFAFICLKNKNKNLNNQSNQCASNLLKFID